MSATRSRALALALASLIAVPLQSTAQSTCAYGGGNWTEVTGGRDIGVRWSLGQNGANLSGTVNLPYCEVTNRAVTGVRNGSGPSFFLTMNAVHSDQTCPLGSYFDVFLDTNGCHTGSGLFVNDDGGSDSIQWSKACDVPSGEANQGVGWSPEVPTAYIWDVTLFPASVIFDGRTVTEEVSAVDNCYFTGAAVPEFTGYTKSATVQASGYRDTIGWLPGAVNYFRSQNRAPCTFSAVQRMRINCSTSSPSFITNGLSGTIGVSTVSASRAGQTQTRVWP